MPHGRDKGHAVTLGIDIGGTAVKAAVLNGSGFRTVVSNEYARPDRQTLARAIRQTVLELGEIGPEAVGLCVPGKRAADGGSIELAVNVPGLVDYPFGQLLADAGVRTAPTVVVSDATAATVDAAADCPVHARVLGIAIGTGVGAALVEHGRPITIGSRSIDHLGQVDVGRCAAGDVVGPDGGRNSLEGYIGVPALRRRFGPDFLAMLPGLGPDDPALVALCRAIRISLAIYEPDRIVLMGGLGLAMRGLEEQLLHSVRDGLSSIAPPGWQLGFGSDRFHAARGACRMAGIASIRRVSPVIGP